jgi:hypothetical protein
VERSTGPAASLHSTLYPAVSGEVAERLKAAVC